MPLEYHEIIGFRVYEFLNFFLWPFPLKWDSGYTKLMKNSKWKLLPFSVSFSMIWIYATGCLYCVIKYGFLFSKDNFKFEDTVIHALASAGLYTVSVIALYPMIFPVDLAGCVTYMIQFSDQLSNEISNNQAAIRNRKKVIDPQTWWTFAMVGTPAIVLFPYIIVVAALYTNIDALHCILEEFLPHPFHRSLEVIIGAIIFRAFSLLFTMQEALRIGIYGILYILIVLARIEQIMLLLTVRNYSGIQFHSHYTIVRLLAAKVYNYAHLTAFLGLSIVFWICVISCFFVVNRSPDQISMPIYIGVVILFVGTALANKVLVPLGCEVIDMMVYSVKVNRLRAKLHFAKNRTYANRLGIRKVQSILPVRLKYSFYWYLGSDIVGEYLHLIVTRCVDAILITA